MDKIIGYCKECRKHGFNDEYIKDTLKQAGHQEHVIEKALYLSGTSKNKIKSKRNLTIPLASILVVLAVVFSFLAMVSLTDSNTTGHAVRQSQGQEIDTFLAAKRAVMEEQIGIINQMNLTIQEKQQLIEQKTLEIDQLFTKIHEDRQQTLNNSIELINSILRREH